MKLSIREYASVLAGLRLLQDNIEQFGIDTHPAADIATDAGTCTPLTSEEIDELCKRINT